MAEQRDIEPDIKSFKIGVKDRQANRGNFNDAVAHPVSVRVEDENGRDRVITFNGPTSTDMIVITMALQQGNDYRAFVSSLDTIYSLVDNPRDKAWLRGRLLDRQDPFEMEDLMDMMTHCVEQWSANPIVGSSDSSGASQQTGGKQTGKQQGKGKTSSRSRQ